MIYYSIFTATLVLFPILSSKELTILFSLLFAVNGVSFVASLVFFCYRPLYELLYRTTDEKLNQCFFLMSLVEFLITLINFVPSTLFFLNVTNLNVYVSLFVVSFVLNVLKLFSFKWYSFSLSTRDSFLILVSFFFVFQVQTIKDENVNEEERLQEELFRPKVIQTRKKKINVTNFVRSPTVVTTSVDSITILPK
jgi:hypothetical protein